MFWNTEFLDASPSHIDVLLQMPTVKLSDILFEDDLLQELKTSNSNLINFLNRTETITELVDNITLLTEKDCCDKLVYSKVHAAYISCEILSSGSSDIFGNLVNRPDCLTKIISCLDPTNNECTTTKVVPQKANLVSKVISTVHMVAPALLSCHISQNIELFSRLIDLLVDNVDVSGSFEILCTFIKPTGVEYQSIECRYHFCEILGKLHFVDKLIDVMTNSDSDDKQRNACQLLCDIIVLGRQCAADQKDQPVSFDLLTELLQSKDRVQTILEQMFSKEDRNPTAIICGMKVLQVLIEKKVVTDAPMVALAIGEAQEAIEKYLIHFHELLLNPPKQEPIKTTFGIIQKPLGYIRLEVVNLIRALISTNSPLVIKKLVELKTMKVIIDLFIEYSWNNLLHTQVEQALCLIICNYRKDEESSYQTQIIEMHTQHILDNHRSNHNSTQDSSEKEEQKEEQHQEQPQPQPQEEQPIQQQQQQPETIELTQPNSEQPTTDQQENQQEQQVLQEQQPQTQELAQPKLEQPTTEFPSRALLSQILNECDLIGRLLSPSSVSNGNVNGTIVKDHDGESNNKENSSSEHASNNKEETPETNETESSDKQRRVESERQRRKNGEQANFGHIIQMINSIAINRDLDTIRDHLNEMKDKRPDLHDRWTTFVNVDVASFKEISLYYDVQSASNNVSHRFGQNNQISNNQHLMDSSNSSHLNSSNDNENSQNNNDEGQLYAYFSFTKEVVLPSINVDVLPRMSRSKNLPHSAAPEILYQMSAREKRLAERMAQLED